MELKFKSIIEQLKDNENVTIEENFDTSKEVSFRAGGLAALKMVPKNLEGLKEGLKVIKDFDIPYFIMGKGSNFIVTDKGFPGAIIKMDGEYFQQIRLDEENTKAHVMAGAKMNVVADNLQKAGFAGFEFASGIPGSMGGAVFMNAGAYDGEMIDIIESVKALNLDSLEVEELSSDKLDLSYRHSVFHNGGYVILEATLALEKGDKKLILERNKELLERRNDKQPINLPSAGSFFKRPQGYFAGKLIQDSGLRGYQIGGAQVSEKHSGFIVNIGGATATDILNLRDYCQKTVFEKFGVKLEPEIRILGEE